MKIGFIGTGVMGGSMATNLLKAGHSLKVYNRTRAKAEPLIEAGAAWADSAAECAKGMEIVITIVGFPRDVEEVYFSHDGVLAGAQSGSILVDMTTTSPRLAGRIYEEAKKRGLRALDAPVSGGDTGAKAGALAVMVGGDRDAFYDCLPVFEAMGKNILYMGEAGAGQHAKMANQIAIAGTLAGVCEAVRYAEKAGLDATLTLSAISKGAAGSWQMNNNGPKTVAEDFAPGFYIKHFVKDMRLAEEEARERSQSLPVLETVLEEFEKLLERGFGDEGTQALIRAYREP